MIEGLKPYPTYKDSNSSWVGKLPAHWSEKRAKYFYREVDERSITGKEELMSVSHKTGVTPRKSHVTMFMAESNVGHKICRPDDLVINTMWAFMAALGVARQVGVVSPSYGVYRPRGQEELHPQYIDHLLRIENYKAEYLCRSTGINSSRLRLYPDQFLQIPILCPPPDEQSAIVRFLDHADRRIRRYIKAKRRLIALLNEQKQAIIHRAVTRGLDPNVRLKPSGIEWIGDIPHGWEVRRLPSLCNLIVDGTHFSPQSDVKGDFLYITAKNIKESGVQTSNATFISAADHQVIYRRCPVIKSDVLYIKDGATAGLATVNNLGEPFSILSSVALLRPIPNVLLPEFLALSLNEKSFKQHVLLDLVGGAMTRFTVEIIKGFRIRCPSLAQQEAIVDFVKAQTAPTATLCGQIEREISLLYEYRTRLIADVVTGKLDVREAAAQLPEVVNEQEALEDAGVLVEGDEATDDADFDAVAEEAEA